jgi:hypothetical protein
MQVEIKRDHTLAPSEQARLEAKESIQSLNLFLQLNNRLPMLKHDGLSEADVIQALEDFADNADCLFRILQRTAPLLFK